MFLETMYFVSFIIIAIVSGLILPVGIQAAVAKAFGGILTINYSLSLRPIYIEFQNVGSLKNWQIRMTGASKLIFPILLFIYLLMSALYQIAFEYSLFTLLIVGATKLSWTDLLALENPRQWSLELTNLYQSDPRRRSILPDYFPSVGDRPATYISFIVLAAILLIFISELMGVLNYVLDSDNPPYELKTISQVIGGIGSVLFSIILVILYDKQASISETQSTVQKEQTDLMRRERQPKLSGPYNFRFWGSNVQEEDNSNPIDTRDKEKKPNPNSIQFYQTNAGEGLAQNFRLRVTMDVIDGPHDGRGTLCAVQRMDRFPLRKFGESDLQGGEKDVEFGTEEIKLSFTEPNPEDPPSFDTYRFQEGIDTLVVEGTSKIEIKFTLTWEDEFEKKYTDHIYQTTSEIHYDMDLTDFIQ